MGPYAVGDRYEGQVIRFDRKTFCGSELFTYIGNGSLGAKASGLARLLRLINENVAPHFKPSISIDVPLLTVICTDVFDRFVEENKLAPRVQNLDSDESIAQVFQSFELPPEVVQDLRAFLTHIHSPLAIRSSSLLEDASYQPFAGIYKTFMIPNNQEDPEARLADLCRAIKMVYASTYHSDPKAYMDALPNRLEEEKMAVVIQQVVGKRHGRYHYPDLAGVGRSLNFYPMGDMTPEDGVVSVALGIGKTVVDGGQCVRFCPAYPRHPIQSFTPQEYLRNSQRTFLALDMEPPEVMSPGQFKLVALDLSDAERDGTLGPVGSVYSPDNDAIYDGISRPGIRLVTMASILKAQIFPLPDITSFMLKVGEAAASCPVEMEFAVSLSDTPEKRHDFSCLQIRPLVMGSETEEIQIEQFGRDNAICLAHKVLGNGFIRGIRDLVYVRSSGFERSKTAGVAEEIGALNGELRQQGRPYMLIGPGRWGSADPWLGIPVKWANIAGVRCIVETDFEDIQVDPSQGSHFFQNVISFGIGYLTVHPAKNDSDVLDLAWLDRQPAEKETRYLRHLRFESPLDIAVDGKRGLGLVAKPRPS